MLPTTQTEDPQARYTTGPQPLSAAEKADLQAKAEAATPGEWYPSAVSGNVYTENGRRPLAQCPKFADGQYIAAADPTAVLALLAESAALLARAAQAEAQVSDLARELTYEQQMRQETEKAMTTLADRVKGQQAELASQEVQTLALLRYTEPLAFPAHTPPETEEQYFCLVEGNRELELLLWGGADENGDRLAEPVWQEWDEGYYPVTRRVRGFWLHPLAPAHAAMPRPVSRCAYCEEFPSACDCNPKSEAR